MFFSDLLTFFNFFKEKKKNKRINYVSMESIFLLRLLYPREILFTK